MTFDCLKEHKEQSGDLEGKEAELRFLLGFERFGNDLLSDVKEYKVKLTEDDKDEEPEGRIELNRSSKRERTKY